MSEKKELKQEELNKVNGGENGLIVPFDGVHAPTTGDNALNNDGVQGNSNNQRHAEVIL